MMGMTTQNLLPTALYTLSIIQNGYTCLMFASVRGFTETVSVLLAAKADPNITDEVKLYYSHY